MPDNSALLLPDSAYLQYTPDGTDSETPTITYCAWDTTSGTSTTDADTTTNGGSTAFGAATDTASLAVNDAPVLTPATPRVGHHSVIIRPQLSSCRLHQQRLRNHNNRRRGRERRAGRNRPDRRCRHRNLDLFPQTARQFQPVGTVSQSSALLLPNNASLRYTPNYSTGETASITYRAWDATSGTSGTLVNTTVNGGTTAFSSATDTASLTVTSVNHAPVLTPATPSLGSTTFNTAKTISLATFINNGSGTTTITDADSGAVIGGIALTGTTGKGTWAYSLDGTNFTDVGTVAADSALLLPNNAYLRYTPDGTDTETATITYRAWDTTSGTSATDADTTTNGGATAFSTASDTASLSVTSPNHAPVLTPAGPSLGTTTLTAAITVNLAKFINNGSGTTTITDADRTP